MDDGCELSTDDLPAASAPLTFKLWWFPVYLGVSNNKKARSGERAIGGEGGGRTHGQGLMSPLLYH